MFQLSALQGQGWTGRKSLSVREEGEGSEGSEPLSVQKHYNNRQ